MILFWDSASWKAHHHLIQMKLMFIFHLHQLPETSLGKQTYNLQIAEGLPGLIQENSHHLDKINFESSKFLSKWQFRKMTRAYVNNLCKLELLEESKPYKKLDHNTLATEQFEQKEYFKQLDIEQVRDRLRLRAQMFGDFRGSFPSKYRRQGLSLKCKLCDNNLNPTNNPNDTTEETIETQNHYLELCPLVSDLKDMHDTGTDIGIIQFFRAVMHRRAELDN